jgi:hypothetical protein
MLVVPEKRVHFARFLATAVRGKGTTIPVPLYLESVVADTCGIKRLSAMGVELTGSGDIYLLRLPSILPASFAVSIGCVGEMCNWACKLRQSPSGFYLVRFVLDVLAHVGAKGQHILCSAVLRHI